MTKRLNEMTESPRKLEAGKAEKRSGAPQTPCFTAGTKIATRKGDLLVEDLRVGDWILTRDNGYRQIRWIGARHFDEAALSEYPELCPIQINAGALGENSPAQDLRVSPQHRMLLANGFAIDATGESEVLTSAKDLVSLGLADATGADGVTYYHILFDAHEIVLANGAWSESFNPELAVFEGLHERQRAEILLIFPELASQSSGNICAPARMVFHPTLRAVA